MKTQEALSRLVTEYDDTNNKMIQHFGNDAVRIEFDETTGRIAVFVGGELVDAYENLTVDEFENVQRKYAEVWFELTNKCSLFPDRQAPVFEPPAGTNSVQRVIADSVT